MKLLILSLLILSLAACGASRTRVNPNGDLAAYEADPEWFWENCPRKYGTRVLGCYDHEDGSVIRREPVLLKTNSPQPIGAGSLAKLQVVGVVNHTTCVGVFVVNPHRQRKRRLFRGWGGIVREMHRNILPHDPPRSEAAR